MSSGFLINSIFSARGSLCGRKTQRRQHPLRPPTHNAKKHATLSITNLKNLPNDKTSLLRLAKRDCKVIDGGRILNNFGSSSFENWTFRVASWSPPRCSLRKHEPFPKVLRRHNFIFIWRHRRDVTKKWPPFGRKLPNIELHACGNRPE
jgi:hypothetical protein